MFVVPALVWLSFKSWVLWRGWRGEWERDPSTGQEAPGCHSWYWPSLSISNRGILARSQALSPGSILVSETTGHDLQVRSSLLPDLATGLTLPTDKVKNLLQHGVQMLSFRSYICVRRLPDRRISSIFSALRISYQLTRSKPQSARIFL